MPRPYRVVSLGVLTTLAALGAGHLMDLLPGGKVPPPPPTLLSPVYANPAELTFADTLRSGETVSQLLGRSRLLEEDAGMLLEEIRHHQDPQRMRPGALLAYRTSFVSGSARGIQVRLDADRRLILEREMEGWQRRVEEVPVRADTIVLMGEVESSFIAALGQGEDFGVTDEERRRIAEVLGRRAFPHQIDFRRDMRRGTSFRILYERMLRPDGSARTGRVLAARIELRDRRHEAFLFVTADGREEYYSRRGESVRRLYFGAPLQVRRISSAFSRSRFHPILGVNRPHNGIDYAAPAGTPVRAVGDGVVWRAAYSGGYGNVVEVQHSHGYLSRYAHLRGFRSGIRPGQRVRQGEVIGYVGMTGLATGPHLHFEFHSNGRPVNPATVRFVPADPVPARYRSRFHTLVELKLAKFEQWDEALRLAALHRSRQRIEAMD